MNKIKEKITSKIIKAQIKKENMKNRIVQIAENNDGESLSTSQLAWIIVAAVIVLALGVALYAIFKDSLLPEIQKKLEEIFNIS